jgi:DNA-binding Xre family transcriptional regulator
MIVCKIKEVLEEKELSLYWLAKEMDMSYSGLHTIAASKGNPNMKTIDKICGALKCQVGDLFVWIED